MSGRTLSIPISMVSVTDEANRRAVSWFLITRASGLLSYVQDQQGTESGDQDADNQQRDFESKVMAKHFFYLCQVRLECLNAPLH